jgi:hypothetical protein
MDNKNYDLLEEAVARFMEIVGVEEGVWWQSQWPAYGITPEMALLLKAAHEKHFGGYTDDQPT